MIQATEAILNSINSPVRKITAKAELYKGSALADTFNHNDRIISFTIERIGDESKFFGYGVCQKLNLHLIDKNRELAITTDHKVKMYFNDVINNPDFYVTEVNRDEKTNELSITAYCALYESRKLTVSDLGDGFYAPPTGDNGVASASAVYYTVKEFAEACAFLMGLKGVRIIGIGDNETCFNTVYDGGANFDGTESIREALTAVAEATQTIYHLDGDGYLVFKRLDMSGEPVLTIDKSKYIELDSKTNRRLTSIVRATELGDNVSSSTTEIGTTQFVRDNPFWSLRDDIVTLLDNAIAAVGGLTINQFECTWRGNFLLEIGDKIAFITKDDDTTYTYLLDDVIHYNGTYSQESQWIYDDNQNETPENPTSLGDAIKQTYAKVDKINKQISLVASEASANSSAIAALRVNTDSVSATVEKIETQVNTSVDGLQEEIETIKKQVDTKVTAEDVTIQIKSELENGVDKVTTHTGFTFDDEGLTIEKSDSELSTQITENGMTIYNNDTAVLNVKNYGVDAANLHATTYLLIGENSRFEDYEKDGEPRTGCFFVGG